MAVDYDRYLDGTLWPSESSAGPMPVEDMPPQYAASALAKLLRLSGEFVTNEYQQEQRRAQVRASTLGRALTAQAISLRDFAPDEDPSLVAVRRLAVEDTARLFARGILEGVELEAMQAAQLATHLATYVESQGFTMIKEN